MAAVLEWMTGDTGLSATIQLVDRAGVPVNLTAVTRVRWLMTDAVTGALLVDDDLTGAEIVDTVTGKIARNRGNTDTLTTRDTFRAVEARGQVKVTFSGGTTIQSFPEDGFLRIVVRDDLAP